MDMNLEIGIFLAYACAFFCIIFFGKLLSKPFKVILKLLINSAIGFIVIMAVNLLGGAIGVHMALNWITAVIVGLLGIPGLIIVLLSGLL